MAKALTLLGFAKKAGKLNAGTESCIRAIITGKAKLVIISNDAGDSIKSKVIRLASENDIKYIIFSESEELSRTIGDKNKVVFTVNDENFAQKIVESI